MQIRAELELGTNENEVWRDRRDVCMGVIACADVGFGVDMSPMINAGVWFRELVQAYQ